MIKQQFNGELQKLEIINVEHRVVTLINHVC